MFASGVAIGRIRTWGLGCMEIKILGTAAAEGWPAVFCACETCRRAREVGGKNIRSRASVQFGPRYKIDLPPDTWYHEALLGFDLAQLSYLFITHSHGDHWSPKCLHYLVSPFSHGRSGPLNVYGSDSVIRLARERYGRYEGEAIVLNEVEPFVPVEAGDMLFTPVRATHMADELCLNYVVSSNGAAVLYACDTSWYPDDTWEFLEAGRLDAVISECTCGPHSGGTGHMDFERLFAMQSRLEQSDTIAPDGVFVATHFSHNVGLLHEELEHILRGHGIRAAYDGMEITL